MEKVSKQVLLSRSLEEAIPFQQIDTDKLSIKGIPLIKFAQYEDFHVERTLNTLHAFDWIIFTSHNGIHYFFKTLEQYNHRLEELNHLRFGTVGSKTAETLKQHGFEVDFVPEVFDANQMGKQMLEEVEMENVLLVKGTRSRIVLDEMFEAHNIAFSNLIVYQTTTNSEVKHAVKQLLDDELHAFVFTSPSSIQAYMELGEGLVKRTYHLPCFCIGETTASYAREVGFEQIIIPEEYTIDSLALEVENYFKEG
ncbi:uroporphyrinogen-III synthase [Alkalibacillus silvisoli]|uniref:Uroporphyrinogen-III synthase n=1 Tax=Alkalibacillus silvisoli TaxID=392823 RepID=A0ABP3JKX1_9BACI